MKTQGPSQPFIYTLPEQFIEDKSVPLHWKLYTIVNGFWISGRPVFASNTYFAEKLRCTERNVQLCLAKLEEMGLLERIGQSQNRTIVPAGGRTAASWGGEATVRGRDEATVRHISDSNISDSKRLYGDDAFKEFWSLYPKKEGKGAAWTSWKKLTADDKPNVLQSVRDHIAHHDNWKTDPKTGEPRDGGRFIPNPATFLNQRRFEDEVKKGRNTTTSGKYAGL